jgi:hypothetical protein
MKRTLPHIRSGAQAFRPLLLFLKEAGRTPAVPRRSALGAWVDGDGVCDTLEVETRGPFKGPRAYDGSGLEAVKMLIIAGTLQAGHR